MLIGCCIFLLKRHSTYQFQRVFAVVLLMLSVGFFNNFLVAACRNLSIINFLNTLLILYDYIIVGGYMMFTVTLVFPGRFSFSRLALFEIPYLVAMLVFAITQSPLVYPVVQVITLVISSVLLVWLGYSIKRHDAMLRDNVGNIEHLDLSWSAILIVLLYVVQLIWAVESLSQQSWFTDTSVTNNFLFDTLWCLITIFYVLLILRKIIQQQVFVVPPQEEEEALPDVSASPQYYKTLDNNDIDTFVRKKK